MAVEIYLARDPDGNVDFRADLDIPSGTLDVGDADATHELEIGSGRHTLALTAVPADNPELIRLWVDRS